MAKRDFLGLGFVSWMVAFTVLSLVSFEDNTSLNFDLPYFDKIVHFTFYFVGGILGMLYFWVLSPLPGRKLKTAFFLFIGLILYGIIIEVLQGTLTTHRSAEGMDILANSAGAFLGIMLIRVVFNGKTRPN